MPPVRRNQPAPAEPPVEAPTEPVATTNPENPPTAPAAAPPAPEATQPAPAADQAAEPVAEQATPETGPTVREDARPPLADVAADSYNRLMTRASATTTTPADVPEEG